MIIGVDAGALSIFDERLKVGVWRVTNNLLRQLIRLDKKNIYRLYVFAPLVGWGGENVEVVVLPRKGWFRLWLPLELRRRPTDKFLALSQAIPPSAKRTIGFVYDLGFLHHPDAYPDSLNKLKNQTEDLVKRADKLVTISQNVSDDIKKHYGVNSLVAYPGVDSRFKTTGEKFKSEKPYFLFVGALKIGKNIPLLLKAFVRFSEKYDLLLVGGDYWMDPNIKQSKGVKFLGVVSDEDLAKYYRGAIALVIPSLWEGFCLPAVEAMACGCPVISLKTGALPEIIDSAGLLTDNLAEAMKKTITDDSLRKKLILLGLKRAKEFSWTKMAKSILRLLQ